MVAFRNSLKITNIFYTTRCIQVNRGNISIKLQSYFTKTMTRIIPPDSVRGMKILDREKFKSTYSVPTLEFCNTNISSIVNCVKKYLLKLDNFKPIQTTDSSNLAIIAKNQENGSTKCVLVYINPNIIQKWSDFEQNDVFSLLSFGITENDLKYRDLVVTYENWRTEEIFKAVLPLDKEIVSGYSMIGHIVHLNLREHHLDYKHLIGQVLIDKNKLCSTVVNKTNQIDNTFRNFKMEVLCGDENFIACVKENRCRFEFDFSKVYWNSRLCTEHERILKILNPGDILFDIFAGVGPFSVPAAKKCIVFANDLNPDSYNWLNHNTTLNKVNEKLKTFNMDGRDFIQDVFLNFMKTDFKNYSKNITKNSKIHITMNLPALALTFLDVFHGILKNSDIEEICSLPIIIHVYFFTPNSDKDACQELVSDHLGYDIKEEIVKIAYVRNVAPKKEMMRVSFNMPYKALCNSSISQPEKRKIELKVENEPMEKIHKL